MIRCTLPLLIAVHTFTVAAPTLGQEAQATQKSTIESLKWLAGSWSGQDKGATTDEVWMSPKGGTMLGINRVVADGKTVAIEHLKIVESNGVITYFAGPADTKPTAFRLKTSNDSSVVFENPEHDFPQRIIYRRDEDRITAKIEGKMGGEMRSMEWHWEKTL